MLSQFLTHFDSLVSACEDLTDLLDMAIEEKDEVAIAAVEQDVQQLTQAIAEMETQRLFYDTMDSHAAYVEIQSGSGGTEAQDWAEMLLRMYTRWADGRGFPIEVVSYSPGEVAGIKNATLYVKGHYAFGWLRTETGIHRLVRKSPFDSGNRRHTSFASVFILPDVEDEVIDIDINPADLRIDTFRASGAGGQHVNKVNSAVRITHAPSGIVVQCQSDRSQHRNKQQAMNQLRAKLYEQARQAKRQVQEAMEQEKCEINWGYQIRSYVLDASRIKDLRTGVEKSNTQQVLDGDLDDFMRAGLQWDVRRQEEGEKDR